MTVDVVSTQTGRRLTMSPSEFGKVLYMARLHGWMPERRTTDWPDEAWNTNVFLPHIGACTVGDVSNLDAAGLAKALRSAALEGDPVMKDPLFLKLMVILGVAMQGEFEVQFQEQDAELAPGNVTAT